MSTRAQLKSWYQILRNLGPRQRIREAGERWEPRTQRHETVWIVTPVDDGGQMRMAV